MTLVSSLVFVAPHVYILLTSLFPSFVPGCRSVYLRLAANYDSGSKSIELCAGVTTRATTSLVA